MGKVSKLMRQVEMRRVASLTGYKRNARTHSEAQVEQIVASVREFGWTNPVLIDAENVIIAGHARVEAAKRLVMDEIPCIVLAGLTDAQKRAYAIADNKLPLNAGWDEKLLGMEFAELKDLGFNLDLLGFDASELADVTQGREVNQPEYDENVGSTVFMVECPKCGHQFPK